LDLLAVIMMMDLQFLLGWCRNTLWKSGDESWKTKGPSLPTNPICSGAEVSWPETGSCRIEVQGINELFVTFFLSESRYIHKVQPAANRKKQSP
jgi:hypothetical protein